MKHINHCTREGVPLPVLPLLLPGSGLGTGTEVEKGWVKKPELCERDERKLPASMSSSEPRPWWHSTSSTRSSFSLQVSVGMFLRIRYWRRSFTFNLISWGRWKAVSCSKWQVEHLRRFSCETEQNEQKSFLQSQHTCWGERREPFSCGSQETTPGPDSLLLQASEFTISSSTALSAVTDVIFKI